MDENWDHYVTHIPRYDPARNWLSRVSMYDLKDLILTKTTTQKEKKIQACLSKKHQLTAD